MSGDEVWNVYKTKRCNFADSGCPQGLECRYHHSEDDRRRMPPILYQPYLCLEAIGDKHCTHDNCRFCRNYQEYLYHPQNFKTRECVYMKRRLQCVKGIAFCPYYHSPEEKEQFRISRELLAVKALTEVDNRGYETESEDDNRDAGTSRPSRLTSSYIQPDSSAAEFCLQGENVEKYDSELKKFLRFCSAQVPSVDIIGKFISACLNTDGGVLFYGATDSGTITGVELTRRNRDVFLRNMDNMLNRFTPQVPSDLITIKFLDMHRDPKTKLTDCYLVRIVVQPGARTEVYFTHKAEAYLRKDTTVVLLPPQNILAHYAQKMQKEAAKK